jgi:predicted DNA-binding protein YlxM (UPF0122 family)
MKAKIDKFFSDNYEKLIGLSKAKICQTNRDVCPVELVSNTYLYILKCKDKITEEEIQSWAISYINTELTYPRSVTLYTETKKNSYQTDLDEALTISKECDLIQLIDNKDLLDGFETKLDRTSKIIWEVYYKKGMRTAQEIADHFQIDRTSAHLYKKQVLDKLKEYAKTEKRL